MSHKVLSATLAQGSFEQWTSFFEPLIMCNEVNGIMLFSLQGYGIYRYGMLNDDNSISTNTFNVVHRIFQCYDQSQIVRDNEENDGHRGRDPFSSTFQCCDHSVVFVQRTFTRCVGVSKYKRMSVVIERLPFGYLIAVAQRPTRTHELVVKIGDFCDKIRET